MFRGWVALTQAPDSAADTASTSRWYWHRNRPPSSTTGMRVAYFSVQSGWESIFRTSSSARPRIIGCNSSMICSHRWHPGRLYTFNTGIFIAIVLPSIQCSVAVNRWRQLIHAAASLCQYAAGNGPCKQAESRDDGCDGIGQRDNQQIRKPRRQEQSE